jgi:hypothetical protein
LREEGEQRLEDNVRLEELALEQRDPGLAATIAVQQAQARAQADADPGQASSIEEQADERILSELAAADPELARNLEMEQDLGVSIAPLPPAAEARLEAAVIAEEAQFDNEHADLSTTIAEQQADAWAQIEQDPARAAELEARLEREVEAESAAVDPQLAANLEKLEAEERGLPHGGG